MKHGLSFPTPAELRRDLPASIVVFLVAMPLCMGIALASGVPVERGILTGIVGGIVTGLLAGSPLQVSGPAAGLAVIVFTFVQEHGLAMLAPVVLLAGLLQLGAGALGLGRWFRAISPAVIHGMLAAIGILIVLAQLHVVMDLKPLAGGLDNIAALPQALTKLWNETGTAKIDAVLVGIVTIMIMIGWERFRPQRLALLPGALVAVVAGTAFAAFLPEPVLKVEVPATIFSTIAMPTAADFWRLTEPALFVSAAVIALIASAETLLSAAAVDRMHDGVRTRHNKELVAQGAGNVASGLIGGLPITGVIVRSSANVQAGAATRLSAVLHGLWILAFLLLLPGVLKLVPLASLAAVLLVTGWRLVKLSEVRELFRKHGAMPAAIWIATVSMVILTDLLTGVLVGLALSLIEIAPQVLKRFRTRQVADAGEAEAVRMELKGSATFPKLPHLLNELESIPADRPVTIEAKALTYMDHTTAETLQEWVKRERNSGRPLRIEPPRRPAKARTRDYIRNLEGAPQAG